MGPLSVSDSDEDEDETELSSEREEYSLRKDEEHDEAGAVLVGEETAEQREGETTGDPSIASVQAMPFLVLDEVRCVRGLPPLSVSLGGDAQEMLSSCRSDRPRGPDLRRWE